MKEIKGPPGQLTPAELAIHEQFPQYSMTQKYYVYLHRDICGMIQYVGKGCAKRAWHTTKRDAAHKAWINDCKHDYIEIVDDCLTELQSYQLENKLLREEEPRFNKLRNY
jgi:hypothetical protein